MRKTYRYGHRSPKRRHVVAVVIAACVVILGPIVYVIYDDLKNHGSASVEGNTQIVGQVIGDASAKKFDVNESLFTMKLPLDWKEISRQKGPSGGYTVVWQATKKPHNARWLTLYVDNAPADKAVNRLLPITVLGNGLSTGDVSDNCSTFTGGGHADKSQLKETPAKWQGVNFICNLPGFVDNEVGVGTVAGEVNQVVITGPQHGAHKYFFLYTDHDIQPDYTIFIDALVSFHAK